MHILLNAAFATGKPVGISRYLRCLTDELSRIVRVSVLATDSGLFEGIDCEILRIPAWTRTHRGRLLWQSVALSRYCDKRYDVLLCPLPEVPPGCPIPTIAVVHDLIPLVLPSLHTSGYKMLFWLSLQSLHLADAVITVSGSTRRDLARRLSVNPLKVHVIPEGPGISPVAGIRTPPAVSPPFVLYVGGFARHKNVVRLVCAFAGIEALSSARLVLVGWGTDADIERTRAAITRFGLTDRASLSADVSDEELGVLYGSCQMFVFPSLYEGFGLPVLEALAHGAPVACSAGSSLPELAGKAALYFNPGSVDEIRACMSQLAADARLRAELGAMGYNRGRQLSWRNAATRVVEVAAGLTRTSPPQAFR